MLKVVAINGSPNQAKGYRMILKPFLEGLKSGGTNSPVLCQSTKKSKPCSTQGICIVEMVAGMHF